MIVDAHLHLWKKISGKIGNQTPVKPLANGMIRIGRQRLLGMPATHLDCSAPAEFALAEFNAAGVDVGVVVQEPMDGPQNNYLLEIAARHPRRFVILALPNFWHRPRVATEARKLLSRPFAGIKLPANHLAAAKIPLNAPEFMPVYEHLESENKILAVDLFQGPSQVPAMESILKSFPTLRVALGHFGMPTRNGWPAQLRLAQHKNVYLETGGIIWLFRHEGYPFPCALAAIDRAKKEVGIEKLMWGSDWPRTMVDFTYRQSLDFIRLAPSLTPHEKSLILGKNAARLYALPPPASPRTPVPLITEG